MSPQRQIHCFFNQLLLLRILDFYCRASAMAGSITDLISEILLSILFANYNSILPVDYLTGFAD